MPGDLGPSLASLLDQPLNLLTFFRGDGILVERGFQVLMVPFPALFGRPRLERFCDLDPARGALLMDKPHEKVIFAFRPRSSPL
jgi:hypothetical protein